MGFDKDGKRVRRKISGRTKTDVQGELDELGEEMGRVPKATRSYTVSQAVAEWPDSGLPGRSERTKTLYAGLLSPEDRPQTTQGPD